jgi:hypothetical protein
MHSCRHGSDCDLSVYEGDDGFAIEIPRERVLNDDIPPQPSPDLLKTKEGEREFFRMRARIHDWYEASHEQITLPHAGEWLHEPDLDSLRARLLDLRALGYRIPDRVFADIEAKMNEAPESKRSDPEPQ